MLGAGSRRAAWGASFFRAALAQVLALGLLAITTVVRFRLGEAFPTVVAFTLYYPVILVAALAGGWPAALSTMALAGLLGWYFFLPPGGEIALADGSTVVNLGLFALTGLTIAFAGVHLHALVHRLRANSARLAERELRYRTLFDSVSEGFGLVQAIRDPDGRLVDYTVIEANPALLGILSVDSGIIGRRHSEVITNTPPGWLAANEKALTGKPIHFEYHAARTGRWFEIQLFRVAEDQLAQLVREITDRKLAELRQSEMFDELNHRVKNNLAMVSSLLALQGRTAPPEVREHLLKAVDRIQAIAEVHESLYRSSRKDDVDFAAYLGDLCRRLQGSLLDGDRVSIRLEAEPAIVPLDRAVALGVVVNELVTNAAKHAYPAPACGEITVCLAHVDRGLLVSVADQGRGLPAEPSSGLGMRLIRSMAQQIGGALEVEREGGAVFRVRVPEAAPHGFVVPSPQGQLL